MLRLTTVSLLCSSTAWCKMQPFTEAGDGLCLEDRIAQNGVVIKHIYGGERRCCANHATDVLHDAISGNNNLTNVPGNGRFIGSCSEQGDGSTNDEQGLKRKQILHHLSVARSQEDTRETDFGNVPKQPQKPARTMELRDSVQRIVPGLPN